MHELVSVNFVNWIISIIELVSFAQIKQLSRQDWDHPGDKHPSGHFPSRTPSTVTPWVDQYPREEGMSDDSPVRSTKFVAFFFRATLFWVTSQNPQPLPHRQVYCSSAVMVCSLPSYWRPPLKCRGARCLKSMMGIHSNLMSQKQVKNKWCISLCSIKDGCLMLFNHFELLQLLIWIDSTCTLPYYSFIFYIKRFSYYLLWIYKFTRIYQ